MRIFAILSAFALATTANAERPVDCSEVEYVTAAKITDFSCNKNGCAVLIQSPITHNEASFIGYTLSVGNAPNYELVTALKPTQQEKTVEVTVYGTESHLSNYRVWAAYQTKGQCPMHSVVNLEQHNQASQAWTR